MIEFYLFSIIAFVLLFILQLIAVKKNIIRKLDLIACIIFDFYIAFLIKFVFFPIPFQDTSIQIIREINGNFSFNLIPFKSVVSVFKIGDISNSIYQFGGNFILLLPMGIYISILFPKFNFKKKFIILAISSLSIEMIQLIIGLIINCQYRVVDIDDVIFNIVGGLIGLIIGLLLKPLYDKLCNMILS